MRKNKVDIITLGCSKNLVDSEQLMRQFQANGYNVSHDPDKVNGEIVVVNTCGFIGDAQEESINMILELGEAKKKGRIGELYVMGCLSERFLTEMKKELPEVNRFYGKFNWKELITDLGKSYNKELASERILTTPSHYGYLKISEGCDRTCSYCSIPIITGRYKSRPIEEIEEEVRNLVAQGVREFQVIAQDLTYYGLDKYKRMALPELLERISDIQGVKWIRLHYAYPAHFPYDLLRVMRERDTICKYLDIALQHISDPMLKLMRRNITKAETYDLLQRMRDEVPGIHLRTTLMVGHPGETEQDFEELIDFTRKIRFERMGAFAYSHETGTYAYKNYRDDIPQEVKQDRLDYLMRIQEGISAEINESKTGQELEVVVDREDEDFYIGRTQFDSPEVDPEVLIEKTKPLKIGGFYKIKIERAEAFDLYGKPV
ncbi:30S ribosomal protein S12 methylthiotransferase RimO [Massilibacteroides sp.]|uniref:30S ribosomal protein S12 methylthiotransferase RimO n=1 Tax=Massilibacteroides sp. TaxID=2034766 RepID=UPI00261FD8CD|nr:30S ribosomal protein S12 methylthiotransferase RimO [Massilibacteroides sp.]MDD4515137.1 30S ribosomal protein S12 methylthiotransferase RimO [Massilibacteroides sp.]